MKKSRLILFLVLLAQTLVSGNLNEAKLGRIQVSGSGCQYGRSLANLSRDAKNINISISNFQADASQSSARCEIGVPIHVPRGYQVSIARATYKGQNNLNARSSANLEIRHFFGRNRSSFAKSFKGRLNQQFRLQDSSISRKLTWSSCSRNTDLQINANLRTERNGSSKAHTFNYQLAWRRCR